MVRFEAAVARSRRPRALLVFQLQERNLSYDIDRQYLIVTLQALEARSLHAQDPRKLTVDRCRADITGTRR